MLDRLMEFATRLGELSGIDVAVTSVPSYERLAQLIQRGDLDLAWLSPISLVSLARSRLVRPMLSLRRDGLLHYRCALIVSANSRLSKFEELRGKRAAWVDRHSASGFVLPRIELAAHGVGQSSLGLERLYGSHDAVVRAVASGRADFGATFVHVDENEAMRGAWSQTPGLEKSLRVMTTFGEIPPDAIATRYGMDDAQRTRLTRALTTMTKSAADRQLLSNIFGARGFDTPRRATYESLRKAVFGAYRDGLLEIDAVAAQVASEGAATTEQRAVPSPTRRKLTSETRPKRRADETQEADVIEVVDARVIEMPSARHL